MHRGLHAALLALCLSAASCDNGTGPETIRPIRFEKTDYTIEFGRVSAIPFTGGSGHYELTASRPDILGRFTVDAAAPDRLYIRPSGTGTSALTVADTRAKETVTLKFKVEEYTLTYSVTGIDGTNANPYIKVGSEIRFIRDDANSKPVGIANDGEQVADGFFDIERSDMNIFTLHMDLRPKSDEARTTFEYTIGGSGSNLSMFKSLFCFDWEESPVASAAKPAEQIRLILTDTSNGCNITCAPQPYKYR